MGVNFSPEPRPSRSPRGVARWLYTSNPFYVISAGLVFAGLRASFAPGGRPFESGLLMAGLVGYALLLAATAWALIRVGRVWDDARTVLLLVVLMFLAISATFDYTLVAQPSFGRTYDLAGLALAVAVSEALLRGTGLRLPALFRVPYHLMLALFFVYPIGLGWLSARPGSPALQWALWGFAPAAGLVFMTLLPAIRRGASYLDRNGSPWRWPLYPWVLFGLLAAAALVRAYWVCVSFHFVLGARTIFGPYMLAPLLLCLAILVVEIGRVSGRAALVRWALAAPLALLPLTLAGHRPDPIYGGFLRLYAETLGGTPAFVTLAVLAAFYATMALRRLPTAADGLAAVLAAFAWVGPATIGPADFTTAQPWALAASGAVLAARALVRSDAVRGVVGSGLLLGAAWQALPDSLTGLERIALIDHAAIGTALVLGLAVADRRWRLACQAAGLALLGLTGLAAPLCALAELSPTPGSWLWGYPLGAGLVALGYEALTANRLGRYVGLPLCGIGATAAGGAAYARLRAVIAGLDGIALGMVSFTLAALISAWKAGVRPRGFVPRAPGVAKPRPAVDPDFS